MNATGIANTLLGSISSLTLNGSSSTLENAPLSLTSSKSPTKPAHDDTNTKASLNAFPGSSIESGIHSRRLHSDSQSVGISSSPAPKKYVMTKSNMMKGAPLSPHSKGRVCCKPSIEIETMAKMLQSLAAELKQRDTKIGQLENKIDCLTQACGSLEDAETKLEMVTTENQALLKRLQTLESSLALGDVEGDDSRWKTRELQQRKEEEEMQPNSTKVVVASPDTTTIDRQVYEQIKLERDSAMIKAGLLSVELAESRATADELCDQLQVFAQMVKKV